MKKRESKTDQLNYRYERARLFEQEALSKTLALNSSLYPKWIEGTDCFVYERETKTGKEYRLIDALATTDNIAFDHIALAHTLSQASGEKANAESLPICQVNVCPSRTKIEFEAFNKHWCFHSRKGVCEEILVHPSHWLISPDGKKAAFVRDYNLWVRDLICDTEQPLTYDGKHHYAYATIPERADLVSEFASLQQPQLPQALWSPDSKKLFTMQTDERQVTPIPVTAYVPSDGSVRPKSWQPRYALPGDKHIVEYRMLTLDIESGSAIEARYPRVLDVGVVPSPFLRKRVWWSSDSRTAYFVDMSRCEKQARVVACNTQSGESKVLFEETAETFIDLNFMSEESCTLLPLPDSEELIWFSERSGWAHLYLYDLKTGELKHPITEGQWLVREIVDFDSARRDIYLQAAGRAPGRDPYYREICRVNINSCKLTPLASGDYDYYMHKEGSQNTLFAGIFGRDISGVSGLSPKGNYFVTTRSRVDQPSVSELRNREGKMIMELLVADISSLPKSWQWPEPVKLRGADNKTDIYGVVFRPTHFDPNKQYPVIDYALGLSIAAIAPKGSFFSDVNSAVGYLPAAAWAELGFIVVIIDGRGTAYRSKRFHDESYGRQHTASNLEDHIAGIKQLAKRYAYMDINRVGITGPGGCNAPAYGLLAYPDFYKVGVACSIYDPRLTFGFESFQGLPQDEDYRLSILGNLAANLQGKLLLIHGMLDNLFASSGVFQLIEALIRENKNFDMLILPNGGHLFREGYQLRRAWDYMVTHLQGNQPPTNFTLRSRFELE